MYLIYTYVIYTTYNLYLCVFQIKVSSKDQITDIVNKLVQYLMIANSSAAKKGIRLNKFLDFLRIAFDSTGQDGNLQNTDSFYKVEFFIKILTYKKYFILRTVCSIMAIHL